MGKALYRSGDQTGDTDDLQFPVFLFRTSTQLETAGKVLLSDSNGTLKEIWPGDALQDPTNLSASASGDRDIALSWTLNSGGIEDEVVVHYSDDEGSTWSELVRLAAGTTSYTDQGGSAPTLTDGERRDYRVRVEQDNGDTSGWSNTDFAITDIVAPTLDSATALNANEIELQASFPDNYDSIEIWRDSGGGFSKIDTVLSTAFPYTDSGLADGTTYTYYLIGKGPDADSGQSNQESATTSAPAPETLRPNADLSSLSAIWSDTDGNGDGWDELDEASPDSATTQISASVDNGNSETVSHTVLLEDPTETHDDTQTWTVQCQWRSTHGICSSGSISRGLSLTVRLREGATIIASQTFSHSDDTWGTDTFDLTQSEINAISDQTKLRIEVEATITSPCCDDCGTQFPIYTSEGVAVSQVELDIS